MRQTPSLRSPSPLAKSKVKLRTVHRNYSQCNFISAGFWAGQADSPVPAAEAQIPAGQDPVHRGRRGEGGGGGGQESNFSTGPETLNSTLLYCFIIIYMLSTSNIIVTENIKVIFIREECLTPSKTGISRSNPTSSLATACPPWVRSSSCIIDLSSPPA